MTRDKGWRFFWALVVAIWLWAALMTLRADAMGGGGVPMPGSSEFIRWCKNDASNAEWILWMCWLYV